MFKKFILAAAAALALSFVFVSCDKEDDPINPTPAGKTAESVFNFKYTLQDANSGEYINVIKEAKMMLDDTCIASAEFDGTALTTAFADYTETFFNAHKNATKYWIYVTLNDEAIANFPDVVNMDFSFQYYSAIGNEEGWDYFKGDYTPNVMKAGKARLFTYCTKVVKNPATGTYYTEDEVTKEVMDQNRKDFAMSLLKPLYNIHTIK